MQLSRNRLSFTLVIPVGLVFGFIGGAIYAYLGGNVNGYLNPVLLLISVICGGIFGVAHSIAGLGGGLVGAVVANACETPLRSRILPAIVGSAVANAIGWAAAYLVLTQTLWAGLTTPMDPTPFLTLAVICTPASSIVAGLLVALDERFPHALGGVTPA